MILYLFIIFSNSLIYFHCFSLSSPDFDYYQVIKLRENINNKVIKSHKKQLCEVEILKKEKDRQMPNVISNSVVFRPIHALNFYTRKKIFHPLPLFPIFSKFYFFGLEPDLYSCLSPLTTPSLCAEKVRERKKQRKKDTGWFLLYYLERIITHVGEQQNRCTSGACFSNSLE